jgi:hypothetical protein
MTLTASATGVEPATAHNALEMQNDTQCAGVSVQQRVPQSSSELALELYDDETRCASVLLNEFDYWEDPEDSQESKWVNISSLLGQGLTYHTCPSVTWQQHLPPEQYGPVDTFVWWYNPCRSSPASVTFNISRLSNGVSLASTALLQLLNFCWYNSSTVSATAPVA